MSTDNSVHVIKCKNCGATADFDIKKQLVVCHYCDSTYTLAEYNEIEDKIDVEQESDEEEVLIQKFNYDINLFKRSIHASKVVEDEDKMDLYSCTSCGAEIIATKVSGTAKCPYCYNNLIFVKQFTGELKPDLIIPFKLEKEDAIKAYNKHLDSRKLFLPKVFKKQNHIDEIQGVYVPYWLFDAKFDFDYAYKCKKVEKWQKGPFDFVKNSKYDAYRDGTIAYINVPRDGSKRMDDLLMDSIEPFDISDSQNFSTYYIAGHPAERYDVPFEDCINDAIKRMEQTTYDELNETLKGYEEKKPTKEELTLTEGKVKYALYPVWCLNTTYRKKKYSFIMNGQTGVMSSDKLPVDILKVLLYELAAVAIVFILVSLFALGELGFSAFGVGAFIGPILGTIITVISVKGTMKSSAKQNKAKNYISSNFYFNKKEDVLKKQRTTVHLRGTQYVK